MLFACRSTADEDLQNQADRFCDSESFTSANSSEDCSMNYEDRSTYYISVYIALMLTAMVLGGVTASVYAYAYMLISSTIHEQVFSRMTRAPVRFFDSTPRGRIVHRFSGDMNSIDGDTPHILYYILAVSCPLQSLCMIVHDCTTLA